MKQLRVLHFQVVGRKGEDSDGPGIVLLAVDDATVCGLFSKFVHFLLALLTMGDLTANGQICSNTKTMG